MYEFFEHTADLGLRVRAPTLEQLFHDAAVGLFAMVVEAIPRDDAACRREFSIRGTRHDYLLFDWLNELLFVFDTERQLLSDFRISFERGGLTASALARPLDVSRHRPIREVKAITYHELRVESIEGGWIAELIVDI